MDINKYIGKRVKKARAESSLSQKELGRRVKYSVATISQLESGLFRVSIESLAKIAQALNKPLVYFIPQKDEKKYTIPSRLFSLEKQLISIKKTLAMGIERVKRNFVYIAVSGNISAGKSSLVQMLAKELNGKAILENEADNPYLPLYYKNKKRWALQSQLFFLTESFKQYIQASNSIVPIFQDRTTHEQFEVFITTLHKEKILNTKDYQLLKSLYESTLYFIQPPDLIIFLKSSIPTLLKHISSRGRGYEKSINKHYLEALNNQYQPWIKAVKFCPVLIIDNDKMDFLHRAADFQTIVKKVKKRI